MAPNSGTPTPGSGSEYGLGWTADGKYLAIADRSSPQEPNAIFLPSTETDEKRRLTFPPAGFGGDVGPALSPDGTKLAFIRFRTGESSDLYVLPLAAGKPAGDPRQLTSDGRRIFGLSWTADGRAIVFSSDREGARGLWKIAASGGFPERLAFGEGGFYPSISRRGRRLVYMKSITDTNIWRVAGRAADKAAPTKLISSTWPENEPRYSPDGLRIAFTSERSGSREIWVSDGEGGNPVQLTSFGGPHIGSPCWSPDGRWLIFDSVKDGPRNVYLIRAEGGAPRRLTSGSFHHVRPSWSRDGRWIYFGANPTGEWQIWKIPAQGGEAIQVTKQGGREARESPDGKFLYYTKFGAAGIWKMPMEGGAESLVWKVGRQGFWTVGARGLLVGPVRSAIWFHGFDAG